MNPQQLVSGCLNGNAHAQRELYNQFAPLMMGVCYRYTKSVADAEDVLQEGFVKVFKNLHQYRGEGELGAWIRRVMVYTAINYLKQHIRYNTTMHFDATDLHVVSDDDPQLALEGKALADLIRQLPAGYQTIFNLYAVEGYSHAEIGKIMGIKEVTSRSQYARARALLINWLQEDAQTKTHYAGK